MVGAGAVLSLTKVSVVAAVSPSVSAPVTTSVGELVVPAVQLNTVDT
jgi:hypothetical protein